MSFARPTLGLAFQRTLALVIAACFFATSPAAEPPKADRSVHLGYPAQPALAFSLEMVVEQSTPGSYFMACGWNTGYFGIQELSKDRKVALFSVWDPTQGDDPTAVKPEERVELLHQDPKVRIKRFGGEGTGGQCMVDFPWNLGETNRFTVTAQVEGQKTAYSGHLWDPSKNTWRHLVTFRTRTGGQPLKGLYSFVEDFRRDTQSALVTRRARFGNVWVRPLDQPWIPGLKARFTASGANWEAKDTIDAGVNSGWFFLATGGAIQTQRPLNSTIELPPPAGTPPTVPSDLEKLLPSTQPKP